MTEFKHLLSKVIGNMTRFTAGPTSCYSWHAFDATSIMLLNALIRLGLSEKEASVYMMLLRIGASPVSSLAKRLGMKRVTTYAVLDSLAQKGYVAFQKFGTCRRYIPQDPQCILESLERRNEELKLQLTLAQECVQQLQSLPQAQSKKSKSFDLFYGKEAEERLNVEIDKESPVYIVSFSQPTSPHLKALLRLLKQWKTKVHLSLRPHEDMELGGDLFIQEGKVLFFSVEEQAELSVHVDGAYAKHLKHLFITSYDTKITRPSSTRKL